MNYSSLTYILLLPAIVLGYYALPAQWRNAALLAVSLALYLLWWPAGIMVMAWVTMASYLGICRTGQPGAHHLRQRIC